MWVHLFTRLLLSCSGRALRNGVWPWEQNKLLVVNEKGSSIKMSDAAGSCILLGGWLWLRTKHYVVKRETNTYLLGWTTDWAHHHRYLTQLSCWRWFNPWQRLLLNLIGCVLFSFYLYGDFFLLDHLTVWQRYRLLIVIICLCRGVASLGIVSIYVLSGQVERNWGTGWRR